MNWILIALIAPLLWSLLNHADKYLISKYSKDVGIGGLVILSSLFAFVSLPFIDAFHHEDVYSTTHDIIPLMLTGSLMALAILFYLKALDRDDASHVVPFWFLIPPIAYALGIFLLGETLETAKVVGSLITLSGAFILSLEFEQGFKIKKHVPLLMIGSSFCIALSDVTFKAFTPESSFWHSTFWNQVGIGVFGLVCLFFVRSYRRNFVKVIRSKAKAVIGINVGGEIIQTLATMANYYSMLLAPVALVLLISYTFQPLFVFIEGLLLTTLFPHIIKEKISRDHLLQKLAAMIIMGLGIYLVIGS